jgi:uncharacterized protein YndB with AHSA1/START domain
MSAIIVEETYNAPVAKVWQALTNKDKMKQWYFDLSEFKPEVGFEFSFKGTGSRGSTYIHHCKITEVIPLKKLQYSWEYEEVEGFSLVTFELFEEGDKTRLKLTHTHVDTFPQDNPDFVVGNFVGGWTQLVKELLMGYLRGED